MQPAQVARSQVSRKLCYQSRMFRFVYGSEINFFSYIVRSGNPIDRGGRK